MAISNAVLAGAVLWARRARGEPAPAETPALAAFADAALGLRLLPFSEPRMMLAFVPVAVPVLVLLAVGKAPYDARVKRRVAKAASRPTGVERRRARRNRLDAAVSHVRLRSYVPTIEVHPADAWRIEGAAPIIWA